MNKLKHEAELVKAAILAGMKYGEDRGAVVFEPSDSASEKILFIYRLLMPLLGEKNNIRDVLYLDTRTRTNLS
ncbi:MAG: DUF5062 family protein [Pseudomonadota bacterium]